MTPELVTTTAPPQAMVSSGLDRASEFQMLGKLEDAAHELEKCAEAARATPYEIEFATRIRLGMTLAEVYLSLDRADDARAFLAAETAFARRISDLMQATGTVNQKRMATSGYLQIRDRATQVRLLGNAAPELNIEQWLQGDPVTLADLRGRVVLIEFWATWCKPCQEMLPELGELYRQESAKGLEIIAITRHYMAYGGTSEAKSDELNLMRTTIAQNGITFPVGVAADETMQTTYGANGLPTAVLIDRAGIVRYAGAGLQEPAFKRLLAHCLAKMV